MEELKEHEVGTTDVKEPSHELSYTYEFIMKLNNLAKKIISYSPEEKVQKKRRPIGEVDYYDLKITLVKLVHALSYNLIKKSSNYSSIHQLCLSLNLVNLPEMNWKSTKLKSDYKLRILM